MSMSGKVDRKGWRPIETAPSGCLVLLWVVMMDGSPVNPPGTSQNAFDLGWLEDGDWMIGPEKEPSWTIRPSHWRPLPKPPESGQ